MSRMVRATYAAISADGPEDPGDAQACQGEDVELVAVFARFFQQIGCCGLTGKQQNPDRRQQRTNTNCRIDSIQSAMITSEISMSG